MSFTLRIRQIALFALFQCLFLSFAHVNALPLEPRQAAPSPTSLMTIQTLDTVAGPMTETCVITLTPITDANGQPAVEEVKNCKFALSADNSGAQPPPGGSNSAATVSVPPTTVSLTTSSSDPAATSSVSLATTTAAAQSSVSAATSLATAPPTAAPSPSADAPVVVNGISSIAASIAPSAVVGAGASAAADSAASISASAAASAAAEQSPSTSPAAAFQLPGRQLSVLPIGLGVFAGISVIALIVVGLVTYERTKYRKAFRQRKLAESGQEMGYGGMAQR
ncbi:hypothetical protein BDN72DRAFT_833958 [Pluteus cervinus]|uniref:Uncharacterized protein n=1 Tax=Pluteus cervinus TaxID=181527 RepID=A0ACD3B7R4_9AGAR|nr:hypothetical protein BDN72DRAFT_833958 [Pluteus cervinus]